MTTALRTNHIQDEYERPVPGASIYVYNSDGSLASLTSDGTTVIANPLTSDAFGNYSYYALAGYYREDVWFGGKKRWSEDNVAVGSPAGLTVTPQFYGAKADGVTDDSAAFVAAIAALHAFALNDGSVFYKGSPKLFIPAGNYYLGTTALDITHTLIIEGEGSGQFGPSSAGCTHLRWAHGTSGIRIQAANTSGNINVDGGTHDGAGGVVIRDICLEGGFVATEGDYHGLVIRNAIKATNLYIKNWSGEGVKAWAGNVIGQPAVSGNVSTTMLVSVKTEGCRGGIDIRGSDANVVTTINCEGYQNRQFGLIDDNGAGSNTHIGFHAASNGVVTGTWPQTQCSSGSNLYAAKWGGDPTVAPSGTTADTANWLYILPGAPVTNLFPAWVNTPGTFRAGGDYLTLNSASAELINCYSETGGFSQFSTGTHISFGTMTSQYFRGGVQELPLQAGGKAIKSGRLNCYVSLQTDANEAGISTANYDGSGSGFGSLGFTRTGGAALNCVGAGLNLLQAGSAIGAIDNTGVHGVASVTSISGGVGYATGAGAAVTQLTNKSTATPAINKVCGQVTMNAAALAGGAKVSFVVTNSTVAATDTPIVSISGGGTANAYRASVTAISAGVSFTVTVENITGGSLSEAPVVNFAIIKAVAA